jgi:thioredoxin 1
MPTVALCGRRIIMPGMNNTYAVEPSRAEINALDGAAVVEFGASWCSFCRAARPLIASAFSQYPSLRYIKIEDGKGRPLGRSFRVTLWPTLIFMKNGKEITRLVRPGDSALIDEALREIVGPA